MIVRELFTTLGLKVDSKSFKQGDQQTNKVADGLKKLASAAVLGAAIRGFSRFVRQQVDLADNIGKTSKQLGIQVGALQELRFAADLAGVEASAFDQSLALLQKNANEAASGMLSFKEDFDRLGISVKDANGELKDGPTLLAEIADGMNNLDNESERVALSLSLMGRSGRRLLPLFEDGAEGINAMRKEAQQLGFVLGEEDVAAAEFAKDEFTRLGRVVLGMKNRVFLAVLPSVTEFTGGLIEMGKKAAAFLRNGKLVEVLLTLIGAAAAAMAAKLLFALGPLLLPVAKLALLLVGVALAIEDVIIFLQGGKSAIGAFIDAVFGLGAADEFVQNFRAGIQLMGEAWDAASGSVLTFGASLLGLEGDFQRVQDAASNIGAAFFDAFEEARAAALRMAASVLIALSKIPGVGRIFKGISEDAAKLAIQARRDVSASQARTVRRGIGAAGGSRAAVQSARDTQAFRRRQATRQRQAQARQSAAEGRATLAELEGVRGPRAAQERRRLARLVAQQEQAAGDVSTTGRATGRGVGAGVELVRRGVARTGGNGRPSVIEGDTIRVDIRGVSDPEEIERRVTRVFEQRDSQNRRATRAAVRRTKEAD